jgi:hypothetical protein
MSHEFVIPQPSAENPTDGDVAVALLPRAERPAGEASSASGSGSSAAENAPAAGIASEHTHSAAAASAAEDLDDDGSPPSVAASSQRTSPSESRPDKNGKPTSNPSTDLDHQIERLMQCECVRACMLV